MNFLQTSGCSPTLAPSAQRSARLQDHLRHQRISSPCSGVEKQEDLALQAADFDGAVLIEDWHSRLSKFDGDCGQSR
jgi:hypothetical protein